MLCVTLPLRQNAFRSPFGIDVQLASDSVLDTDLSYYWYFPPHDTFTSHKSSTKVNPLHVETDTAGEGRIWIKDNKGNRSPCALFSFFFIDTTGPAILHAHEDTLKNDPVAVGDSSFFFRVFIFDKRNILPLTASINGENFKDVDSIKNIFTHFIDTVYKYGKSNPRTLLVTAKDKLTTAIL